MSSRINNFFVKFNVIHKVAALYHPLSNREPEQLISSLKDRLYHVNKNEGFNSKKRSNIAVRAYLIVPYRDTSFLFFEMLYVMRQSIIQILLNRYVLDKITKVPLNFFLKMFEYQQGVFLSYRRYHIKIRETFDKKIEGCKELNESQTVELLKM